MSLRLQEGLTLTIVCICKNSNGKKRQNCRAELSSIEKEQEDKRQLQKKTDSLLEQLGKEDKA